MSDTSLFYIVVLVVTILPLGFFLRKPKLAL